jgi:hypothetical protein
MKNQNKGKLIPTPNYLQRCNLKDINASIGNIPY